jgi:hydroxymethylbilane synthase
VVPITTSGDRGASAGPADKSRFVKEIEEGLLREEVDLAVHSAKDLPAEIPDGLELVGAPPGEDSRDALVGAESLDELGEGARIGTSSLRRRSQLLARRPDLDVVDLRGNVDTRLRKLTEGGYDAIVLALAGLRRLGREREAGAALDSAEIVPAAGQGILALEARRGDERAHSLAAAIGDTATMARLEAERAVVAALDTSCRTPVGVSAAVGDGEITIDAYVGMPDGTDWIRDQLAGGADDPGALGRALADRLLAAGAQDLLRRAEASFG